jgi:hypothetical protein
MFVNQPAENNVHAEVVAVVENPPNVPGTNADEAAAHAGNKPHEFTTSYAKI